MRPDEAALPGEPTGATLPETGPTSPDVHPVLTAVFAAFDDAGIVWCLLRGEAQLADPPGDIDLLVAETALPLLDTVLIRAGFRPTPAWGAGAHRAYLGRDAATDRFFEIDVEWTVEFGPSGPFWTNWRQPTLRTDAAAGVLARRRRVGPLAVPAPDDAFWLLLLHCIVDKGAVAPRHRARLAELVGGDEPAAADGVLGRIVTARCPPGWTADRVLVAVREGRWSELVALGGRLPGAGLRADRVAAFGRGARRLAAGRGRQGISVAVLGPDGAGKSTLVAALAAAVPVPTRIVYMGLWGGEGDGEALTVPGAVLAALRRPFRSLARAAVTRGHQAFGRLVVLDRHPYDALLPATPPHGLLKRVFFAVLARTAPAPTLTLVLDVPPEIAMRRRPEEDLVALAAARREYLALARRLPRVVVLDAARSPEAVRAAAIEHVWRVLATR